MVLPWRQDGFPKIFQKAKQYTNKVLSHTNASILIYQGDIIICFGTILPKIIFIVYPSFVTIE